MLGPILKYFLLGSALGAADQARSEWFRHGRRRRRQRQAVQALRYLMERYQPASFEQDRQAPEYQKALRRARAHFREETPDQKTERQLEQLLARLEGEAEGRPPSLRERLRSRLAREYLAPLPWRKKAVLALGIALFFDLWTLFGTGLGAGFDALAWTLLETPSLMLGLLAAPYAMAAGSKLLRTLGAAKDPQEELRTLGAQIEQQKRSLHLWLTSPAAAFPDEGTHPTRALPPSA